jgi:GT2 family glycosyltransferase
MGLMTAWVEPLPSTAAPPSVLPDASVVIPTHNRRESLRGVLKALSRQTVKPGRFEVIVVCDGCTDGTASMCSGLATPFRLKVMVQPKKGGPAAARNSGVEAAAADLIVFLDDDVVPEPELIDEHLRIHSPGDRAVGIGPLLAPSGFALKPWTRWEAVTLEQQYQDMEAGRWRPGPRQFYTGNASVRREHLLAAGGFNPEYRRAEDVELAYRLQQLRLTFHFCPKAKGWHYARRSLRSWLEIARDYGKADVVMSRLGRWVLVNMAVEFHQRRRPLRRLARACVGRPILLYPAMGTALLAAQLAEWIGLPSAAEAGYSVVFNLTYWDTVCGRLGGQSAFWALIRAAEPR